MRAFKIENNMHHNTTYQPQRSTKAPDSYKDLFGLTAICAEQDPNFVRYCYKLEEYVTSCRTMRQDDFEALKDAIRKEDERRRI